MSRNKSRRALDYKEVLEGLAEKGISIRVASPKLVCEEAPESYKVSVWGAGEESERAVRKRIRREGAHRSIASPRPLPGRRHRSALASLYCMGDEMSEASNEGGPQLTPCSPALCCVAAQDVTEVVETCHAAGISKKCIKLRPIAVVKG